METRNSLEKTQNFRILTFFLNSSFTYNSKSISQFRFFALNSDIKSPKLFFFLLRNYDFLSHNFDLCRHNCEFISHKSDFSLEELGVYILLIVRNSEVVWIIFLMLHH